MDLLTKAQGIKKKGIISLVITFTIIGILVAVPLTIVVAVQTMNTDWKNEELNSSKIIWGILTLVLLGPIASIVFGGKAISVLSNSGNTSEVDSIE